MNHVVGVWSRVVPNAEPRPHTYNMSKNAVFSRWALWAGLVQWLM